MVELIWDGKYDASGKRSAPLRLKLPIQTLETVNTSAQQRQMALDMFTLDLPAGSTSNELVDENYGNS